MALALALRNVNSLTLYYYYHNSSNGIQKLWLPGFLASLESLKHLELELFQAPDFTHFSDIIRANSRLKILSLRGIAFSVENSLPAGSHHELLKPPLGLKVLEIYRGYLTGSCYNELFQWLILGPEPPRLNTVKLAGYGSPYSDALVKLLNCTAPSLGQLIVYTEEDGSCIGRLLSLRINRDT